MNKNSVSGIRGVRKAQIEGAGKLPCDFEDSGVLI